ncbi:MAG TPA: DUF3048 domain-containing protein [Patescibacteria group bacterium]|nr:DUF3048 domain-containing protein [Patescibacteria group bacterium]
MPKIDKRKTTIVILALAVYFVVAGLSYFVFSNFSTKIINTSTPSALTKISGDKLVFNETAPKTEACPLNGALYSKEQKNWWEGHRPLGVMIENHQNARPQSGLSSADVVYEVVAEGGITRFLSVFYCQDAGTVGPIRSARTYFLDFISEYGTNPLYTHVGGANQPGPADALSQIDSYGWGGYNDMNQFSIGFPTFWRDYNRLGHPTDTEHTMYSTTQKLWDYAKTNRGLSNVDKNGDSWDQGFVSYSFKDDASLSDRPAGQKVHLEFWSSTPDYFVDWNYDKTSNTYKRVNGGQPHIDLDNKQQLSAKNLVILFMQQYNANDGYENNVHLLYGDKGTGNAIVVMDGKKINATWRKDKRTSRTLLFDSNGSPIKLDRGLIWFSILPTDGVASIK